ncbi:PQQ-binding-like beta-propeller repeat protein [Actinoplanes sp. LDG1-06]|uniref:PQQ-binding-like beta-propeller repeat protein n=1 Tax=Paractinoplanes ovalisporus TaxID=2810368 RepID=A0ABS2AEY3_9ACTN|nr:PQQ-binding-like beta-propeller repeat protein [Actinoplanes ovalisporus]MBM2617796.1 PQQ-binding-like beta-propeller repeat protein [Actinoplanes ovalisporus]
MTVQGTTVIIDLGLERGEPDSYDSPQRSTFPGWFPAAVLAVLVMFTAGAAAAPGKPAFTEVFSLQVGPADAYALTDDGRLLAQTFGSLSAYDLRDGETQWEAGPTAPAFRLRLGSGLILMRPWTVGSRDPGTTAVSLDDGASRWNRSGNVMTLAGSPTLLSVSPVRSFGGANRRVQGPVDAIDPATGRTLWTVNVPSSAVLAALPGVGDEGTRMLLVHDDRTMAVHDLVTGERLVTGSVPAADYDPSNPVVVGGTILLRHPGRPNMEFSAYDPQTLRNLWSAPADGAYEIEVCGILACLTGPDGMRAIEPTTGDVVWARPGWRGIQQFGTKFVAYGSAENTRPLGLIDPDTGELQVDLTGWRPISGTATEDELLVTRASEPGGRTMVAVAQPGETQPRLLGTLPAGTGDCQAATGRLVCRSMYGQLVVWAYGQKG